MKTIISILTILLNINIVCGHDGPNKSVSSTLNEEKVSITNATDGTTSITWSDNRIDEIEIISSSGIFMPEIPVLEASSLHLSSLMNGTYTLKFKSNNETIYEKVIEVQR